ncbi:MAG: nucleoside hydrolase, partial [Chloroflexota bacterium]
MRRNNLEQRHPIILDCDPGHDDAIAIILALASPELDVLGI